MQQAQHNGQPIIGFGGILLDFSTEIAAGATGSAQTQIDATYDFQARYLNGVVFTSQAEGLALAGTPLYYGSGGSPTQNNNTFASAHQCRIQIVTGNRNWFDQPVPWSLLMGDGIHPMPLPQWVTIRAGTTINGALLNGTAAIEIRAAVVLLGVQLVRA